MYREVIASYRESSVIISSSSTLLKPCLAKELALRIWSPRLAAADRGISRLGLRRGQNFTDGVCTGSGDDQVRSGEEMLQRRIHIFILYISGGSNQTFVEIAFSADMYHLEIGQQPGQDFAHGLC